MSDLRVWSLIHLECTVWCPYYLPSFMKFCSVVSEELRWQTVWRTDWQTDRQTNGQMDRTNTICLPTKAIQYTPSVSTIILSGQTYSSQNVRQIWESTLSKSDYLVGHHGRTWEWIFKDLFTFLEVNMSNILWSMRICKRTFFPVCRMIEVFAKISSKITPRTPYSCQEGTDRQTNGQMDRTNTICLPTKVGGDIIHQHH
jgi:hypothetical protein